MLFIEGYFFGFAPSMPLDLMTLLEHFAVAAFPTVTGLAFLPDAPESPKGVTTHFQKLSDPLVQLSSPVAAGMGLGCVGRIVEPPRKEGWDACIQHRIPVIGLPAGGVARIAPASVGESPTLAFKESHEGLGR